MVRGFLNVIAAVAVLAPAAAAAQDTYTWCIDAAGALTAADPVWANNCNQACEAATVWTDVATPLAQAALVPNAVSGDRPTHQFCVGGSTVLEESIAIDNASGIYGDEIGLHFINGDQPNLCADPGAAAGDAVVTFESSAAAGNRSLFITNVNYDDGSCAAPPQRFGEGVDGVFEFGGRLTGGASPLLTQTSSNGQGEMVLVNARIEGHLGQLYSGSGNLLISRSELSGNVNDSPAPWIDVQAPADRFLLDTTAVFKNVSQAGEPLIRVSGSVSWLRATLAANAVLDDGDLMQWLPPDEAGTVIFEASRTVFARNQLLGPGTAPSPSVRLRPVSSQDLTEFCLPPGADELAFHESVPGRESLSLGAAGGAGALLHVVGTQLPGRRAAATISKSYLVETEMGSTGAVIRSSGSLPDLVLGLVNNTVSDHGGLLADLQGTTGAATFASARNILVGSPSASVDPAVWVSAQVTFDSVEGGFTPWAAEFQSLAASSILGPTGPDLNFASLFLSEATVLAQSTCDRASAQCGDLGGDCSGLFPGGEDAFCPTDAAARWVATPAAVDSAWLPYPWDTALLPATASAEPTSRQGALGLSCDAVALVVDEFADPSGNIDGDSDSWTTVVDCDNDQPGVVPTLPPFDGVVTATCTPTGDCYVCPPGTLDADGDLSPESVDCDDGDATIHPAAVEACDLIDSDCDGSLADEFPDADGDGTPDCVESDLDGDGVHAPADCDDADPTIAPGMPELCDGIDQDCDGDADEDFDVDGDGAFDVSEPDCVSHYAAAVDCDDTSAAIAPGTPEACDGVDQDCDGETDEDFDLDGDGAFDGDEPECVDEYEGDVDCDDDDAAIAPGAPEICDQADQDCDGSVDEGFDQDGDGSFDGDDPGCVLAYPALALDCDDSDATIAPGAVETCDDTDSDCDGDFVDAEADLDADGVPDCVDPDADGDGEDALTDCDDLDPARFSEAAEACDGVDTDCDGILGPDEADNDGDGVVSCAGDCDDGDATVGAGLPELCDGIDNDCDLVLPDHEVDTDLDGQTPCDGDCDDGNPTRLSGAEEACDGIDNDCDGEVAGEADLDDDGNLECAGDCDDRDASVGVDFEEACDELDSDCDGDLVDGFDDFDADGEPDCTDLDDDDDGTVDADDCGPRDPLRHPQVDEVCDGIDNDCDGELLFGEEAPGEDGAFDCEPVDEIAVVAADCGAGGCAVSWSPVAWLVVAPLTGWRRRRTPADDWNR